MPITAYSNYTICSISKNFCTAREGIDPFLVASTKVREAPPSKGRQVIALEQRLRIRDGRILIPKPCSTIAITA